MATIFRPPIFVRLPLRPSQQPDPVADLLTLFAPNPARPFSQTDWPIPQRAREPLKSDAPANLLALLQPNPAVAFRQSDWPAAQLRKPFNVDTFVNLVPLQTPAPAGTPFAQADWESPKARRAALKSDAPANMLPVLQPNPAAPFSQAIWDAAARQPRLVQVDAVVNLVPLQNPVAAAPPFFQSLWVTPPLRRPGLKSDAPADMLALLQPNPSASFSQEVWESASRLPRLVQVDAVTNLVPLQNPPAVAAPFAQEDWTAAATPKRAAQSDIFVNRLPLNGQPFTQNDWPHAAVRPRPLHSDAISAPRTLYSPNPTRPFAYFDYPLPRRRRAFQSEIVSNLSPVQLFVPNAPGYADVSDQSKGSLALRESTAGISMSERKGSFALSERGGT